MPDSPPIVTYRLTDHAILEMARREITEADVACILSSPEQAEAVRTGRVVYQSRFVAGDAARTYLLRVFVDIDHDPPIVVTVYRTSKVGKYWRNQT